MSYLGRAGREPGLNHADPFETQYIHSRRNCSRMSYDWVSKNTVLKNGTQGCRGCVFLRREAVWLSNLPDRTEEKFVLCHHKKERTS